MKRATWIIAAVLPALLISVFAFGQMGGYHSQRGYGHMGGTKGHGMMGGCGMMGYGMMHSDDCSRFMHHVLGAGYYLRFGAELELSEKQIEELENLADEFAKARIEKKAELDELRLELNKLLDEDRINLSKVKSLNGKIAELQAELRYRRIEQAVKAEALLGEAQLDELELPRRELRGRSGGSTHCPYF